MLLAIPVLVCAAIVLVVGYAAQFGFDITDESFYLMSLARPADVTVGVSLWHQFLSPVFYATGQSLVGFRMTGMAVFMGAAIFLGYRLEDALGDRPAQSAVLRACCITAVLILGCFYYYRLGLLTPSYNALSLLGAILVVGGAWRLVARPDRRTWRHLMFCGVIGVGCGMAALARPTSGLCLALVVALWIGLALRSRDVLVYAGYSALTALALVGAQLACMIWWLGVDPVLFFQGGQDVYIGLQAGHSIQRLLIEHPTQLGEHLIQVAGRGLALVFGTLMILEALVHLLASRISAIAVLRAGWHTWIIAVLAPLALFIAPLLGPLNDMSVGPLGLRRFAEGLMSFTGMLLGGVLYLTLRNALLATDWSGAPRNLQQRATTGWRVIVRDPNTRALGQLLMFGAFCLLVSFSVSFGTNNHIVGHMAVSAVFAVFFALRIALSSERMFAQNHALAAVAIALSVGIAADVHYGVTKPYRAADTIFNMTEQVDLGRVGAIQLDPATARYVSELGAAARQHGFRPDTALLDLTGGSPGAALILNARAPVMPWIVGGYPGSEAVTRGLLDRLRPEDAASAWILTSPEGRRGQVTEVLQVIGRVLQDDYEPVATLTSGHRAEAQILWRPKQP